MLVCLLACALVDVAEKMFALAMMISTSKNETNSRETHGCHNGGARGYDATHGLRGTGGTVAAGRTPGTPETYRRALLTQAHARV